MLKWKGKVAVVTGASNGIGAQIFTDLARKDLTVIGLARNVDKIKEIIITAALPASTAYAYRCDVSDMESVKDAFSWIEKKFGSINILINNAGVGRKVQILEEGEENLRDIINILNTNVLGMVECTRRAYKLMKKSKDYCYIINMNSILGHSIPSSSSHGSSIYTPTKHAVTALTEVLRLEIDNEKIRVSCISPGYVKTDFQRAAGYDMSGATAFDNMPYLNPEDVSNTLQFLLKTPYNVHVTDIKVRPVGEKF